jgi:hypothetical protein
MGDTVTVTYVRGGVSHSVEINTADAPVLPVADELLSPEFESKYTDWKTDTKRRALLAAEVVMDGDHWSKRPTILKLNASESFPVSEFV